MLAALAVAAVGSYRAYRAARPHTAPRVLHKAEPERALIEAHTEQRYALELGERECAFGSLKPSAAAHARAATDLKLSVQAPGSDRSLRTFSLRKSALEFGFCVEEQGSYELVVAAAEVAGGYELALERVLPRGDAKRKPQPTPDERSMSPRLRATAPELRDPTRLEQFWKQVMRAGTPMIEPADADTSWVTFLYRGSAQTREVSISWQAWTFAFSQTQLARLPGTDLWWKSLRLPSSARLSYQLTIDPPAVGKQDEALNERAQLAVTRADPNNHRPMLPEPDLDPYAQRSVLQLPAATPERWLEVKPKPAAGRLERQGLHSKKLGHEHALTFYLPAHYEKARSYPLLIFFDGEDYLRDLAAPRLLDALIAARAIDPLVAVFVHNDDPSERAYELPCNPLFAAFVADELVPFARTHYSLSSDIGLAGSSFGGLASSYIALTYPERFGKVLSQSGSYWWSFPADHALFDGSDKPGWLRRRYAERPVANTLFYLGAGTFEGSPEGDGVLEQNRLQRDALRALGYSVAYQEFIGAHDHLAWRATLPDALIALYAPRP